MQSIELLQDSAAVQMLQETCIETDEDRKHPEKLLALQEVRSLVCCYLHQAFIADTTLAKLVHFQVTQLINFIIRILLLLFFRDTLVNSSKLQLRAYHPCIFAWISYWN